MLEGRVQISDPDFAVINVNILFSFAFQDTMKFKRTSGKGKRWKKGDSCVSNPENTKFREAARGRFFQKFEGKIVLRFFPFFLLVLLF